MRPDLDVLADATRRLILALLSAEQELCVCELEAALDAPQPVVSRQLAVLREGGWLEARREGRRIYYRLDQKSPSWVGLLLQAYTEGGVPTPVLREALARLHAFTGRPLGLTRAAS